MAGSSGAMDTEFGTDEPESGAAASSASDDEETLGTSGAAAGSSSGEGGGGEDEDVPELDPRWVLLDADGEVVEATIAPACGHPDSEAGPCAPSKPGSEAPYNCVAVSFFGQRYVQMAFRLSDGSATACREPLALEDARFGYPSPDGAETCGSGVPLSSRTGIEQAVVVNGVLVYAPPTQAEPVHGQLATYTRDQWGNLVCLVHDPDADYAEVVPVPTEFTELLGNAPYSLRLIY